MSQNHVEREDRYTAKKVIRDLDLFTYINPRINLELNIPRSLIERVMEGNRDWMDACQKIAFGLRPHMQRMREMRFGQLEVLQVLPPLPPELHILIRTEAGRDTFFVNDTPFYPYR